MTDEKLSLLGLMFLCEKWPFYSEERQKIIHKEIIESMNIMEKYVPKQNKEKYKTMVSLMDTCLKDEKYYMDKSSEWLNNFGNVFNVNDFSRYFNRGRKDLKDLLAKFGYEIPKDKNE